MNATTHAKIPIQSIHSDPPQIRETKTQNTSPQYEILSTSIEMEPLDSPISSHQPQSPTLSHHKVDRVLNNRIRRTYIENHPIPIRPRFLDFPLPLARSHVGGSPGNPPLLTHSHHFFYKTKRCVCEKN